ncbi:tetratricopeptide repeat protein [Spectribacter hydrogenooxidans]|uniref:Tetratricopeptide repeat protein n=1 Tax=Spectribacter hydrogenoxidans TaxID=3075608 RepID=A0ABU3C1U6_9GAMM|nr:tetratricopeptide repeat protein [Salinisphaera sp. W335]MDT0635533.1 tetratricopeptide repeat protein [Salinisphaera sp. W335]
MRRLLLPLAVSMGMIWLAGCAPRAAYPPPPPPDSQDTSEPAPPEGQPEQPSSTAGTPSQPAPTLTDVSGPAVVALLDSSEQLARAGNHDRAAAAAERALDVEPRNPFVYRRLAALYLDQGQPEQAETFARKSNSLAGRNPPLRASNWRLIAEARRARGDTVGADAAASRADYYAGQSL